MNTSMPKKLQEYINSELYNAELYRSLAKSASNEESKNTILEIAECDRKLADEFIRLYKKMTGYTFEPDPAPINESGTHKAILRGCMNNEIKASEKYRKDYLQTPDNYHLRKAFFNAFNDKLLHSLKLLCLLTA